MTPAHWIILAVIFVAVCKVLHMLLTCKPGWEDEQTGFHEGVRNDRTN